MLATIAPNEAAELPNEMISAVDMPRFSGLAGTTISHPGWIALLELPETSATVPFI